MQPPDLDAPFPDEVQRSAARTLLRRRDATIQSILCLTDTPTDHWPARIREALPATSNGVPDPPEQRVQRWANIFGDEIDAVHQTATAPPADADLRFGLYIAGRLLSTLTDLPHEMVDGFEA